jgi:hypothetical protein
VGTEIGNGNKDKRAMLMATKKRSQIPQGVRFDVFRRDNFTCVYCGGQSPDVTLECDHKVAVANGGTDDMNNLVTACWDCNRGKGTKRVSPTKKRVSANDNGLVGLFGHGKDDEGYIKNQFQITGMVGAEACTIQLFSFADGCSTLVEIVPTAALSTDQYTLYASEEQWKWAYWQEKESRGLLWRKTAEEAFEMDMWLSRKRRGEAA